MIKKSISILFLVVLILSACKKDNATKPVEKPFVITDPVKIEYIMKPVSKGDYFVSSLENRAEFSFPDDNGKMNERTYVAKESYIDTVKKTTFTSFTMVIQRPEKGKKIYFKGMQYMNKGDLFVQILVDNNRETSNIAKRQDDGKTPFDFYFTF